ncbi:LOW QUALITY PROTEIN: CD83 antigen [Sceloporus undulatus]|uniref:LOW QUALITY PROTEIN: CD83 antigen n=1 Tax=Sceloporus undulatus TaxID=8520 RepID=UPI001C4DA287|nr:LOW QUALITY PROTEIN: CD83 antigen [Sceloporus undulatus]
MDYGLSPLSPGSETGPAVAKLGKLEGLSPPTMAFKMFFVGESQQFHDLNVNEYSRHHFHFCSHLLLKTATINHIYNMLMASTHCYHFAFLVWHVIHGVAGTTLQVVAACNKDVSLPCKIFEDLQVTNGAVSWYKIGENSKALKDLQSDKQHNDSRELNESLEASNDTWHSLKLRNTTSYSSGTYKCLLRTPIRKHNRSSTVTLKVIDCPKESQDAKHKKYKTELMLLCSLGFFYLLLIFFACTCLKEKESTNYYKSRMKHTDNGLYHMSTWQRENVSKVLPS